MLIAAIRDAAIGVNPVVLSWIASGLNADSVPAIAAKVPGATAGAQRVARIPTMAAFKSMPASVGERPKMRGTGSWVAYINRSL
jgi:hypothetical protein